MASPCVGRIMRRMKAPHRREPSPLPRTAAAQRSEDSTAGSSSTLAALIGESPRLIAQRRAMAALLKSPAGPSPAPEATAPIQRRLVNKNRQVSPDAVSVWYSEQIGTLGERVPEEAMENLRLIAASDAINVDLGPILRASDHEAALMRLLREMPMLAARRSEERAMVGRRRPDTPASDVAPFVDPAFRTEIADKEIRDVRVAFQVTKMRNLPGIQGSGLQANRGGQRIGLSQNSEQKDSLFKDSKAHSKGKVTVGTGSRTIDNYRIKGEQWQLKIEKSLRALMASAPDSAQAYAAWQDLKRYPWLDDGRLDAFFALDFYTAQVGPRNAVLGKLLIANALNRPVILRISHFGPREWTIDPDDKAGFQTTQDFGQESLEVLLDFNWLPIRGFNGGDVQTLLSLENVALDEALNVALPQGTFKMPKGQKASKAPDDAVPLPAASSDGRVAPRDWWPYLYALAASNQRGNRLAALIVRDIDAHPEAESAILGRLRLNAAGGITGYH